MNITHFKMIDEIVGNIETFKTIDEANKFIQEKKIELPIILQLELDYKDDDGELYYKLNLVEDNNSILFSDFFIYKHVEKSEVSYSYTSDFWNASKYYNTIDECLLGWFDKTEKNNDDNYEPSCYSCGDGGCISCRPSWFI